MSRDHKLKPRRNNSSPGPLRESVKREAVFIEAREKAKTETVGFTCPTCSVAVYVCTVYEATGRPETVRILSSQALKAHERRTGCLGDREPAQEAPGEVVVVAVGEP